MSFLVAGVSVLCVGTHGAGGIAVRWYPSVGQHGLAQPCSLLPSPLQVSVLAKLGWRGSKLGWRGRKVGDAQGSAGGRQ